MRLFLVTFIVSVFMGSTVVWSEETTLTVEGMHCSGCKHMISKNVCENKELSATFEKCNVELVDAKKQIGRVILVPKADQKIDLIKVEAAIKSAGDDYKVIKKELK